MPPNSPSNPHSLNIHGFPATKLVGTDVKSPQQVTYSNDWIPYVTQRIQKIVNSPENVGKTRMSIAQFLAQDQFSDSQLYKKSNGVEQKTVTAGQGVDPSFAKFLDPLPPYAYGLSTWVDKNELIMNDNSADPGYKQSWKYLRYGKQRREWGFREKILQGYPEYKPFFSNESRYIVGIVTAGSGVFSGIPPSSNIVYTPSEVYRTAEFGPSGITESPITPTGLCFIQDETGGLGIALGSDIRYIYHPLHHRPNYSNPYIVYDDMHAGSIVIPKADYRQFLRVGDLVIIEVGTNFKYWHAVLGSEPRHWDQLWTPSNMILKKQFNGSSLSDIKYYIDDPLYKLTELSVGPMRAKSWSNRRPYSDNWGGYEQTQQNLKFLSSDFSGRDLPPRGIVETGTYSFYPIQEDHPWSTGTPIPVNTGMPYIMMEEFVVDETERYSPIPIIISASQLRGFPNPKHWKNKIPKVDGVEFDSPKNLGVIDPNLAWKKVNSLDPKYAGKYFDDCEDPKKNPWISDPSLGKEDLRSSDFKGMLVQLKNVRFVLPPEKPQFRALLAPQKKLLPEERTGKNSFRYRLILFVYSDRATDDIIKVIARQFGYGSGTTQELKSKIIEEIKKIKLDSNSKIIASWQNIYEWAGNIYFQVNPNWLSPDEYIEYIISNSYLQLGYSVADFYGGNIETLKNDLNEIYSQLSSGKSISSIEIKIDGKTYSGFSSISEAELLVFHKNKIDSQGFYFNYNPKILGGWIKQTTNVTNEVVESIARRILFAIVDKYTFPGFSSAVYAAVNYISADFKDEDPWDDEIDGDRSNYYDYELVNIESPFPKTVDMQDGGYWWANPDIPLPNARSHKKDSDGSISDRTSWTQNISSNKLPEVTDRFVKDLGMTYSSSYSPFAEEWKPSTIINGKLVMNEFKPIPSGSVFLGNRTYYVADEHNVVIPIRINSNTEIARYTIPIPTGSTDITGIAWQYSLGRPGLEWEREAYMMQIWPRFASDVYKTIIRGQDKVGGRDREPKTGGPTPPPTPPPPTKLPDLILDSGDFNPARLDCESLRKILDRKNKEREDFKNEISWPIVGTDSSGNNIHQDPISGRKRSLNPDKNVLQKILDNMPEYPCKGMTIGQEREVVITSSTFGGVNRRFYFKVGPNGECICVAYQGQTGIDSSSQSEFVRGGNIDDVGREFNRRTPI